MSDMHLMLVDGKVVPVDMGPVLRRFRARHVRARAGTLDQAAALFADNAFDPAQTWDAGLAYGLSDADLDAAAHVAVVLREVELGRD
jgi:hypothetical protein